MSSGRHDGDPRRALAARRVFVWVLGLLFVPFVWGAEQVYQRPEDFVREAFGGHPPPAKVLWLTGERKKAVTRILGHPPPRLRVRYWLQGGTSVWILEEIGKERPITVGVVVENGRIRRLKVLIFRESRGYEVRHDFFARQFEGAALQDGSRLDRRIDGISGATLSVRAVTKLARLALWLDAEVRRRSP